MKTNKLNFSRKENRINSDFQVRSSLSVITAALILLFGVNANKVSGCQVSTHTVWLIAPSCCDARSSNVDENE